MLNSLPPLPSQKDESNSCLCFILPCPLIFTNSFSELQTTISFFLTLFIVYVCTAGSCKHMHALMHTCTNCCFSRLKEGMETATAAGNVSGSLVKSLIAWIVVVLLPVKSGLSW